MYIVAGTHKRKAIAVPKDSDVRPTSAKLRESLFNICQGFIDDARFLDLFAGSGAMGLEALSRGAAHATFVDCNRESYRCIQSNLENLALTNRAQVLFGDVFTQIEKLAKQGKKFDIIFADPPYDSWLSPGTDEKISYSTHLLTLIDQQQLLTPSGYLFIEDSRSSTPLTENHALTSLVLISSRRMGRSSLQQYARKEI